MLVRVDLEEVLGLSGREQSPGRDRWVPQDQRTAIGGQPPARHQQDLETRRVHEMNLGQVEDESLLGSKVGFDSVPKSFAG